MENERKEKNKNIILWGISIFLILSMLVYIGQTTTQAILMGILGILVMPPINKKINEKFINGNNTKNTIKIISEIILFFVIVCSIPTNENTSNSNINNKSINNIISTVSQIDNIITSNESKKNENAIENNTIAQSNSTSSTKETNTTQQQNTTKSTQTETIQNNNSSTKTETSTNTKSTSTSASTNNSSSTNNSTTKSSSTGTSSSSTNKANKPAASSSSQTTTNVDNSRTVYVTPTGKRYHYISTCGGKNSTATTLNKAIARGLTPCQKCAK